MCRYRYTYYSRCQHAECYKVSYCDRAIELGLPQRDNHYSHSGNLDAACASPSTYSSSASSTHSNSQHFIMSTLTPTEAGGALTLVTTPHNDHPDLRALIPRSAHQDMERDAIQSATLLDPSTYKNVNIAIPLDSTSSLSMELTHDGKVTELVARFETYNEAEHSDDDRSRTSSLETAYPDSEDRENHPPALIAGPISDIESASEMLSSPDFETRKHRRPLPSQWTQSTPTTPPTRRGAPMLQTELRSSEREKRKSAQSASSPKTVRGPRTSIDHGKSSSFLTKEKSKPTSPPSSAPGTPGGRLSRKESKAKLTSLPQSLPRGQNGSTLHSAGSSSKPASCLAHRQSDSFQSTGSTEFFSTKQSPVSGASNHLQGHGGFPVHKHADDILRFKLKDADQWEQVTLKGSEEKLKLRVPKLSLKIPSRTNNHKSSSTPESASTPSSGSPTRSKIPRIPTKHSTLQSSPKSHATLHTKSSSQAVVDKLSVSPTEQIKTVDNKSVRGAPQPKTPHVVRHVKTVDSTGATPIITRESLAKREPRLDTETLVKSYLTLLPDQTSSASATSPPSVSPQPDLKDVVGRMLSESSASDHVHSPSVSPSSGDAMTSEDTALKDPAVIFSRKKSTGSEDKVSLRDNKVIKDAARTSDEVVADTSPARGRSNEQAPHGREQTHSQQSHGSSSMSDLRPTAPEFVPSEPSPTKFASPFFPYDPFALDAYGVPWLYHMYPVPLPKSFQWFQSPRKSKTAPRVRKQTTSVSPQKILAELQKFANEPDEDSAASDKALPFASQLEEVARSVKSQTLPLPTTQEGRRRTIRSSPRRYPGNGLYDCTRGPHFGSGIPMDQTAPFPDPVPPLGTGTARHVGHMVEKNQPGCGSAVVEASVEWVGGIACHGCEPDH